ncbi:MAG TPA: FAD-dependent oxidoreductase [Candidatus Dormibacteraeota bacterium]|jgi:glycerol-3-phosphate dehydrogenase
MTDGTAPSSHDAIVIGGGVTGAGVARDLALRGLSVLLLEKGDWGGGTSGASTWMVHGGPRYLEFDWDTTVLSTEDAGNIVRIARHMVHRCVVLVPVMPEDGLGIERLETAMEVYDRYQPRKESRPHIRLTGEEARRVEPGLAPGVVAAVTLDEWGVDPHRLAWANVLDAVRSGAQAFNHCRVESLLRDGSAIAGVRYRAADGQRVEARARIVVNAAGPWAPQVAAMAGAEVRLRPAKGIHIVYDRRLSNFAISAEAVDGRDVILVPHGGVTFLGTTDDDHYGDLDALEVTPDEVDYLLQAAERVFPSIRAHRPVRATAGVRATLFDWRPRADRLSRRFEVIDHEREDRVPGLVTVAGGKLSLYRLMAERTADAVCARLRHRARCVTGSRPLPGASGVAPPVRELAAEHGISTLAATRILARHGSEAPEVLDDPRRGRLACRCEVVTEAELVHAARHEQVRTLADAFRRLGLAAGPCAGTSCVERAAEVIGHELGWSPSQVREAARDYVTGSWRGRAPVLDRWGWAQEELAYGARRGWPGGL